MAIVKFFTSAKNPKHFSGGYLILMGDNTERKMIESALNLFDVPGQVTARFMSDIDTTRLGRSALAKNWYIFAKKLAYIR